MREMDYEEALLCAYGAAESPRSRAMIYLSRLGYLTQSVQNPFSKTLVSEAELGAAVRKFQTYAGLEVTGILDEKTLALIDLPPTDVKPKIGRLGREKRYTMWGYFWRQTHLTYCVTKYTTQLENYVIDRELAKAFQLWADVTPLRFTKVDSGICNINISFEIFDHHDGDPFDGLGGVLAHAGVEKNGQGVIHFDESEHWTSESYNGTNFFFTAAHEIGHILGLGHSEVEVAVMFPKYLKYRPDFHLDIDDIKGIQEIYGLPRCNGISPEIKYLEHYQQRWFRCSDSWKVNEDWRAEITTEVRFVRNFATRNSVSN